MLRLIILASLALAALAAHDTCDVCDSDYRSVACFECVHKNCQDEGGPAAWPKEFTENNDYRYIVEYCRALNSFMEDGKAMDVIHRCEESGNDGSPACGRIWATMIDGGCGPECLKGVKDQVIQYEKELESGK